MIEAIAQVGIDQSAVAGGAAAAGGPGQAGAYDVAHFRNAYTQAQSAAEAPAANALPAEAVSPAQPPGEGLKAALTFFDAINARASDIGTKSESLIAKNGQFAPSEMLDLTMKAHHFMFQATITSNVANRTSDGVQQLFRQQS
ncbi:hypothetical protein [Coralloluteibacterium thermophilus]|uniref:ATP-dependent helicase HrpB n=1 Tax=Coralloluteibacterium thermophilum TaxID=2707049 RepID=A0ABV9NNH5_9GAMM